MSTLFCEFFISFAIPLSCWSVNVGSKILIHLLNVGKSIGSSQILNPILWSRSSESTPEDFITSLIKANGFAESS